MWTAIATNEMNAFESVRILPDVLALFRVIILYECSSEEEEIFKRLLDRTAAYSDSILTRQRETDIEPNCRRNNQILGTSLVM